MMIEAYSALILCKLWAILCGLPNLNVKPPYNSDRIIIFIL